MPESPFHLLIIAPKTEDHDRIRAALQHEPGTEWVLHNATTGREGLMHCFANEPALDLALIDHELPDTNPLDLIRSLKGEQGLMRLPVVVLSDTMGGEALRAMISAGAQDFILKPEISPFLLAHVLLTTIERYRLIRRIATSEANFRTLADSIPMMVWVSGSDQNCTFFNRRWLEFTGRTLEQELGSGWLEGVHPDDLHRCAMLFDQAVITHQEFEVDYRLRRHDGAYRWVLDRGMPRFAPDGAFLGFTGGCIDITDRKEMEQALVRNEARNRALMAAMPDNVLRMDRTGAYLYVHLSGDPPFPFMAKDIIGRRITDVMLPETAQKVLAAQQRVLDTGKPETVEYARPLGDATYYLESRIALSGENEVVAVIRNVTERKRAEQLLLRAQKHESINLLASGIAHDFNNLLTGVLGQASLALRRLPEGHAARNNLKKAISSTERAADLTRQLLAYTGQGAFQVEAIDLNQLILDNVGLFETILPAGAKLEVALAPQLPPTEIDRGQAQQVLMNLVINAAEAIPTDVGVITLCTGETVITPDQHQDDWSIQKPAPGQYVHLKVADNGIGMSEEILSKIFDPYFTTKKTGSGLGLSATLGIVQRCKGAMQVESQLGSGATFYILFPAASTPVARAPTTMDNNTGVHGTILVVDDEAPIRETVSDILAMEGLHVLQAINGQEGLHLFEANRDKIDLVLLDMKMPVMDGEQTYHALRSLDPAIKILLSSGYHDADTTRHLTRQRFTGFLNKPYSLDTLLTTIQEMLEQKS